MSIDGLEESEGDPDVHREDMKVATECTVQERAGDRARAENHDLSRVSVLRSKTERCRVLVVDLVNVLVKRAPVESLVGCFGRVSMGHTTKCWKHAPKKWNMSSKTKKNATWGAIIFHDGKGTCHVDMPNISAIGWKNQI